MLTINIKNAGYPDNKEAIKDMQFSVNKGELVGLIGANGAGKSTTIKTILGLLKDVDGTVSFEGESRYAYVPEHPVFYDSLTLWEHLELAAASFQLQTEEWIERAEKLLVYFRLEKEKHELPSSFSKGMKQKVMLITAFLIQPAVYIIDEPFIGLDPRATKDFLSLLMKERERGAAILMSTHVLDTAERICDRFLLMAGGRLVAEGTLTDIQHTCGLSGASLLDCFDNILERSL
ncbi:ABC transporter ATP-binding protein [Pseudalkalibacillus caeni]|uniref:ABC transporter ATP-binding protein n=1 Tax=Exobacillus caeni TaxID=2574798 RepID=UPI001485A9AC|nr:ABC transporter ATP-binding protein [Pseudalkalibacillus caeni]